MSIRVNKIEMVYEWDYENIELDKTNICHFCGKKILDSSKLNEKILQDKSGNMCHEKCLPSNSEDWNTEKEIILDGLSLDVKCKINNLVEM